VTSVDTAARPVNYRELMKKVEQVVVDLERADDIGDTIRTVIEGVITRFRAELGILGGRLYRRQGSSYHLLATFGEAKEAPPGLKVSRSYQPIQRVLEQGAVYMTPDEPGVDPAFEEQIGAREFAAIEVGEEQYILAFDVAAETHRDDVLFSLGILRHALNQKIRQERLASVFNEALKIQASILPKRDPDYRDFEIHGRTRPMESMGGDFYDFIPISESSMGLGIADVSGHGLPAALQVRDIYMGLRMGLARDFKIVRTIERLNGIIHTSTLTSRFVSMFYGELDASGLFIYVNAGHPPPFHLSAAGEVTLLEEGGPVLGPLSEATYARGMGIVRPGDLLVFYTDGITETRGAEPGEKVDEFGLDRLIEVARTYQNQPARRIADEIFAHVDSYSRGRAPSDDRTVMVVRRTPR
jgi:sigma-B regulation protein RsbU (phosphoserine phosphatase)